MTNVVQSWRSRAVLMHRQGRQCQECGKFTVVRRRLCSVCRSPQLSRVPLPQRGMITALCLSGEAIETLDQLSQLRLVGLVRLNDNSLIACQIGYSRADKKNLPSLRKQSCRLAVRRLSPHPAAEEPITYGIKAVFDIGVLKQLHAQERTTS